MPRNSVSGQSIRDFLAPPRLRAWHENVARGSRLTADIWARSLRLVCYLTRTDPPSLLALEEQSLHELLLAFVTAEEKRGQAGGSTTTHLKAVKSWLAFNGIRVARPIKIRGVRISSRFWLTPSVDRTPGSLSQLSLLRA